MMKPDCTNCTQKGSVFNAAPVPFVVHENLRAQMSAANARLVRVIVLLVVLLVASNFGWLLYESQFTVETTTTEIEQETDGGGDNYIVGRDLTYGETESETDEDAPRP